MKQKPSWRFLAIAPISALLILTIALLVIGYDGRCGLLDSGWDCSRSEYVLSALLNPLILAPLAILSAGWLSILLAAAFIAAKLRRND